MNKPISNEEYNADMVEFYTQAAEACKANARKHELADKGDARYLDWEQARIIHIHRILSSMVADWIEQSEAEAAKPASDTKQ